MPQLQNRRKIFDTYKQMMKNQFMVNMQLIENQFLNFVRTELQSFPVTKECLTRNSEIALRKLILKNLLQIQPSMRYYWMVESIVKLTKNLMFFQKYENQHYECSRVLRFLEQYENKEIVAYNSPSERFFIVLEGEAVVFLKKTPEQFEIDRDKFIKNQYNKRLQQDSDLLSHNHFIKGVAKFKKIKSIKEGDCFGELGILYQKPRMALVIAKTKVQLGILSKYQYLMIFSDNQRKERKNKKQFINNNLLIELKELKYQVCQAILYSFKEITLRINQILFKQGAPFNGIYLIKQGQIIVSCSKQKRLVPLMRVGSGYLLCYNQLKKLMGSQILVNMESTAQIATQRCLIYKFEYKEMIKMFDLKILIKSIVQNFSYMEHTIKQEEPDKVLLKMRDITQRKENLLTQKSQYQNTRKFECIPFFSRETQVKKVKKVTLRTMYVKKDSSHNAKTSMRSERKQIKKHLSIVKNSSEQLKIQNSKMLLVNSLSILRRK